MKKWYINSLVKVENRIYRIKDVSNIANNDITKFINMKLQDYIGFDFDFKSYTVK